MGRQDQLTDLDVIYTKTGTALTTSYTAGTTQYTGQARIGSFWVAVTRAASGSSMSNAIVKLASLDKNGNPHDAITTLNDDSGTTKVNQSLTATANQTLRYLLQTENMAPSIGGWAIYARADGATVAGDSVVVLAA